jgi:Cu/Ag efflux protein CusF
MCTLATTAPPALAAMHEEDYLEAARQLNRYGLVQGDDQGYRFYSQLTRAEMAKLLVYSLGLQNDAPRYLGRGVFADTTGHWAEGIIAVAKTTGVMRGYPEGDFRPQAPLTYAEVVTALSRLVGLEASGEPWPRTYLTPAQDAGIIPEQMNVHLMLGDPAARGDVFVLLWRTLSVVKNAQGQNLLRRYLDTTAPTLAVDPQPKETADLTLTVSGTVKDADQVLVNGQSATVTFGSFRHDVSLRLGPNTIRVQAVDIAGNVREEVVQIERKQSPIGALAVTGPAQVKVGQTASYSVTLKDQNGEAIADRKGITAEVLPAALGSFDAVTGVFTAGTVPGAGSIVVKAGSAQSSVAVTTIPGSLDHLRIDPPVAGAAAKETVTFTVKGYDQYENSVAIGAVHWSASGGTIGATTGVFTVPDTPGVFTVTATASGKSATATVQPLNFQAASVRVTVPTNANLKANGLGEITMTATVLDDKGNTLTDYKGNLTLTSSAPGTASPTVQSVPVTGGAAQFTVRAGTIPGTAQIKASTNLTVSGTAPVTVAPQRLQSIRLVGTALSNHVNNAATGYVEAIALDEDGNPMRSPLAETVALRLRLNMAGSGAARFMSNGLPEAMIALSSVDPTTGDVRTRTHLQYDSGIGTVLIEGTALSTMSWVQIQPGALVADQVGLPARVMIEPLADTGAGQTANIVVVVLDANGFRVTRPDALVGVIVRLRDQNGVTLTGTSVSAGRWQFPVTQTVAGTYTYTASLQPTPAEASLSARVLPAPVASLRVTAEPASLQADNASQTKLRAELVDVYGNRVTQPSYPVTFTKVTNRGAVQTFTAQTVNSATGVAEVTLRAGTVAANEDFVITVANPAMTANFTLTVRGVPDRLALSYGDNNGNNAPGEAADNLGRAGQPLTVFVDVMDRNGAVATYDHGRAITVTVKNMRTGEEQTIPQPTTMSNGRAVFHVTRSTADRYALKAQSAGLSPATTAGYGGPVADAIFQPASGLRLAVTPDLSTLRVGGGSNYAFIKATLLDAAGNPVNNQTGRPIPVVLELAPESNGAFAYGTFTVDNLAGSTSTLKKSVEIAPGASESDGVRFFSGAAAGSKTVNWSAQDGTTGSFSIATVAATAPNDVLVTTHPVPLEPWTGVPMALTGQELIITIRDSNGVRMSDASGPVTVTMKDADTRIVLTWDGNLQGYQTRGPAYPSTFTVNADRGQAKVIVRANTSGMKLYDVTYRHTDNTERKVQANGMFLPKGAENMEVTASAERIRRDGSVMLSARILDQNGQTVTAAAGTVTFVALPGSPITAPLSVTVPIIGGVASATFASNRSVSGQEIAANFYVESTVRRASTDTVLAGNITVIVDDLAPSLSGVSFRQGPIAAGAGTLNTEDEIVLTFSEPVNAGDLVAGLTRGGSLSPAGTSINIIGSDIDFNGLAGLDKVTLNGTTFSALADFTIATISLNATGTTLTIRLGARTAGTDPTLTAPATTADLVTTVPLRDAVGQERLSPFAAAPVTGAF